MYVRAHARDSKDPADDMSQKKAASAKMTGTPGTQATVLERLRDAGLRPTRQRLALAKLLFARGHRHVSAEQLFNEAKGQRVDVSLATVYNALHDFTARGMLREISIDSASSYFDTNTGDHHHFYFERSGQLEDIDAAHVAISALPPAPGGAEVSRVDVIIRIKA